MDLKLVQKTHSKISKLEYTLDITNMGPGQNCTKTKLNEGTKLHGGTKLHEGSNLHEDEFARRQICTKGQFCTSDKFAWRVKFARLSILHGGSNLHGLGLGLGLKIRVKKIG